MPQVPVPLVVQVLSQALDRPQALVPRLVFLPRLPQALNPPEVQVLSQALDPLKALLLVQAHRLPTIPVDRLQMLHLANPVDRQVNPQAAVSTQAAPPPAALAEALLLATRHPPVLLLVHQQVRQRCLPPVLARHQARPLPAVQVLHQAPIPLEVHLLSLALDRLKARPPHQLVFMVLKALITRSTI